jgi:hypothetical protein
VREVLHQSLIQARLLAQRLERLSADSRWARRASGLRGALLRSLEALESGQAEEIPGLDDLIRKGFVILERAAREIGPQER